MAPPGARRRSWSRTRESGPYGSPASCFFITLPMALRGSASTMRTVRGRLYGRQRAGHVVDEGLRRRRRAGVGDHEGDDALAEVVVGDADDRRLAHLRVLEQRRLDLAGAHLVAGGLDEVGRLAPHDAELAGRGQRGDVAGVEEAVGVDGLGGGVGPVQVAGEDGGAADDHLAEQLRVPRQRPPLLVDEAQVEPGERRPDRAGRARAVVARRGDDERLGEAVALHHALAEELEEPVVLPHRQPGRAGDQQPRPAQGAGVGRVTFGVLGEPVVHGRHREEQRAAAREGGADRLGREARQQLQAAADAQRAEHAQDQPVDVEERQGVDQHVGGGPAPGTGQGVEVEGGVAVRDHRPLGRAGGARGVEHQDRILRGGRGRGARRAVEGDAAHLRGALAEGGRVGGQHQARRGVGQDVRELPGADGRVERDGGDAGQDLPDDGGHGGGVGGGPDGDPIAGAEAVGGEPAGVGQRGPLQLGEAEGGGRRDQGRVAGRAAEVRQEGVHGGAV